VQPERARAVGQLAVVDQVAVQVPVDVGHRVEEGVEAGDPLGPHRGAARPRPRLRLRRPLPQLGLVRAAVRRDRALAVRAEHEDRIGPARSCSSAHASNSSSGCGTTT
jgi:hypothetical protein